MLRLSISVLSAALVLASGSAAVSAQAPASDIPGCTLQGKNYVCSKPDLQRALDAAHTIAVVSQPANRASDAALARLVKALGKQVAPANADTPADLTFRLTPIEPAGVSVGANTVDLAMFNIFAPVEGNPMGKLLWSETYNASLDLPWPAVANAVTRQFRTHLGAK